ncbi:glycosyltransferase [Halolamina sp. C58]|uniref:glycosyltransferase n=1 Tax=Halolamina sp. C58 TaxID=3421640 RepID=UPI003EBEC8BC
MCKDLRVCFIINSLSYGGAENLLVDLIDELEEPSFEVVHFGGDESLRSDLESVGAEVHSLDENFRFDPRSAYRLVQLLGDRDFDVIHLHLPYSQTLGRLAAQVKEDVIVVSTQHNMPSNYHIVTRVGERLTRPLDDATVAVSCGVERAFTGTTHEPNNPQRGWSTIYNGINVDKFKKSVNSANIDNIRERYDISSNERVFLTVGRYAPDKGQKDLIQSFASSQTNNCRLMIVGHGQLEEKLISNVKRLGVEDTVHITGRVENVEPYYKLSDVFVSSSYSEGMPVTLIEAMASSLPIIATNIPGVRELIIEGETGYLYPASDMGELTQLLEEMSSKDDLEQYGKAGYIRAKELFDIEQMAESYLKLYQILYNS